MPRLKMEIDQQEIDDRQLKEAISLFVSDADAMQLLKGMGHLLQTGDLGFWLSARLMRKIKRFARGQNGDGREEVGGVGDTVFLEWLKQGGTLEPKVTWEVEPLPNNGGIYKILLQGGLGEKGVHNSEG